VLKGVRAVLAAVMRSLLFSAAFVLLMLVIASVTSARRTTGDRDGLLAVVPIATGAVLILVVVTVTSARFDIVRVLTPLLDRTRTVGLVTLPGASVGVLIGSGDPVQAGAAQLLVLVGLVAAETVAVVITVELVARGLIRRG
jgi:putative ABC transport system permease protein